MVALGKLCHSMALTALAGVWAQTEASAVGEDAWQVRSVLSWLSLGPAPYPHPVHSSYELFGTAFALRDSIKVTDSQIDEKGAVWSKKKMQSMESWQVDLTFKVGGPSDLVGQGLAFWYISDRGLGGNALGGPNIWNGVGVFFDTQKHRSFGNQKHPYIYGIINEGKFDYSTIEQEDVQNGCHIPFRGNDAIHIDQTMARITYYKKTLSVIMKPATSVDWVKCFEINNVKIPIDEGYIGVSAMTDTYVDSHQLLEIKVFTHITMDPMSYAADHDEEEIEHMWEGMRHSGEIAQEYSDMEQKIEEEISFDPIEEDYDYHPDYQPEGEEEEGDDDGVGGRSAEDDAYRAVFNQEKNRRIQERRAKYEAKWKSKMPDSLESDDGEENTAKKLKRFTPAELVTISEILAKTEIGKRFVEAQEEQKEKIHQIRKYLEAEISEASNKLTNLLRDIRKKENNMNGRITALGVKLNVDLIATNNEVTTSGRSWLTPFLVFILLLVGMAGFGYMKYRSFMKTHLL